MACVRIRRGGQLGQSLETLDFQLDCWGPNHSVSGTSENSCRDQEDGQKDQAESKQEEIVGSVLQSNGPAFLLTY